MSQDSEHTETSPKPKRVFTALVVVGIFHLLLAVMCANWASSAEMSGSHWSSVGTSVATFFYFIFDIPVIWLAFLPAAVAIWFNWTGGWPSSGRLFQVTLSVGFVLGLGATVYLSQPDKSRNKPLKCDLQHIAAKDFVNGNGQAMVFMSQGYWVGETEVTQQQYQAILGQNPSQFVGPTLPVESVEVADVQRFLAELNKREAHAGRLPQGFHYDLPTFHQMECHYAELEPSGVPLTANGDIARTPNGEIDWTKMPSHTFDVHSQERNSLGLYGIRSNVAELSSPRGIESSYPNGGFGGGSWERPSGGRNGLGQATKLPSIGFRVVLIPDLQK